MFSLFHFAAHGIGLDETCRSYVGALGYQKGRSISTRADFDFLTHPISLHSGEPFKTTLTGHVVEHLVPMSQLRFGGHPGEPWALFFMDPFGIPIEDKGFANLDTVFNT